ncbi:MAG: hypothetical protein AMXMBFR4_04780 [Candidatus Hydrogenedentota bacterium]
MKYKLRFAAAAVLAVVAAAVLYKQLKNNLVDWYADNYYVRTTLHPATEVPDQVCLTWSDDPRTTQTVQWRTATSITDGWVQFRKAGTTGLAVFEAEAGRIVIEDPLLQTDPVNHRFTATLRDLDPDTEYSYRVGSKVRDTWSDWHPFKTAPAEATDFSFMYLGDAQLGLIAWGRLLQNAHQQYSDSAFYVIAGDLVNSGGWRNEWDQFFNSGKGVFDRRPLIPCIGNHDLDKQDTPELYLNLFALPENGPENLTPERAYSFEYGNVLFVVLDSNESIEEQGPWLEQQLAQSNAIWKIAVYHHPAYSSAPHRDNREVRECWCPLFDKYHVDMALQGHDHAYLRTYPMKDGKPVASPGDGTIYAVTVSGTKYYEQEQHDYAEVAFPNVSTYQVIDIYTRPNQLTYRAYDTLGNVRDEVVIEK